MSDMLRPCQALARRLAAATGAEDLARLAREEAPHLQDCRDCRADLARRDPAALFALLSLETKGDAFFAGFETRVMAGVREAAREERGGWLGALLRPRLLALAAGAAGIAAVVIAVWMHPPAPPRTAQSERDASGETRADPPPVQAAVFPSRMLEAGERLTPLERDAAEPSPVESVASATARVISIKVAGPRQEPSDIVLIVDPEMPL